MEKIIFAFCLLFSFIFNLTYAGGGMTHMYIAEKAIPHLASNELRRLLQDNMNFYLIGSYYPDSGYILGTHYGEDSHWDEFVYTFCDYLRERYSNPALENPKLVAFLFGVASHRISDVVLHHQLYPQMSKHDFKNDDKKAENYGDVAIDLFLNIDKSQWQHFPNRWIIPVNDLVAIYKRMGRNYSAREIILGNSIIKFVGVGERLISPPAYPFLQWRMPWTAWNYVTAKPGGLDDNLPRVVDYQNKLWQRLTTKHLAKQSYKPHTRQQTHAFKSDNPVMHFAENAINSGIIAIPVQERDDGSVELGDVVINQANKFESLLRDLIYKLTQ